MVCQWHLVKNEQTGHKSGEFELKCIFWHQGMFLWIYSNTACNGLKIIIYPSFNFFLGSGFLKTLDHIKHKIPPPNSLYFQLMQIQDGDFKHRKHITLPEFVSKKKLRKLGHEWTNLHTSLSIALSTLTYISTAWGPKLKVLMRSPKKSAQCNG